MTSAQYLDINNNLPRRTSPKLIPQNITDTHSGTSKMNNFRLSSYMAQMERINYLWGQNLSPLQSSHQSNLTQVLGPSRSSDSEVTINSKSMSAIQMASDRIDKAIDVWVYAAKNNDETTRDAAHQEFLASVSSAASASMSSKDTQRNMISNESKQMLHENASKKSFQEKKF